MTTKLSSIIGSDTLPAEMLESIQEAFDAKVAESEKRIQAETEAKIREEFLARFNHDKSNLIETFDMFLTTAVKEQARKSSREMAKLTESRTRLDTMTEASKTLYIAKLKEHIGSTDAFINEHLTRTIKSLNETKKKLAAKEQKLEEAFSTLKTKMVEQQASRIAKMDEFVVSQTKRELAEFAQDKRALIETRAKLIKENKARLKETQTRFITEAAKKVDATVTANLKREMSDIHEDIERNRQNTFGRRIFEAMAAEYMASYLAEGTEVRKLQNVVESKDAELNQLKQALTESKKVADAAGRKVTLAEDRAARTKVLGELLGSLRGDKRSVMSQMLETTKTDALRATFERLLPTVLGESTARKPAAGKPTTTLTEARSPARHVTEVRGDAPVRQEIEDNADLGTILRLAGLRN